MSGKYESVAISSIIVNPDRQRQEVKGIDELAASISRNGLINPLLVDDDYVLIAGERRLSAMRSLGWSHVSVQRRSSLTEVEKELLELDENVKRMDLDWREECLAIERYTKLRQSLDASSGELIAEELGMSQPNHSVKCQVAKALRAKDPEILGAERLSVARGILERRSQRDRAAVGDTDLSSLFGGTVAPVARGDDNAGLTGSPEKIAPGGVDAVAGAMARAAAKPATGAAYEGTSKTAPLTAPALEAIPLHNITFEHLAAKPATLKFNFLHCDFPYGINANKHAQGAASAHGGYEDSPDIYWSLIETLAAFTTTHVSDSAHMMFWFSMTYYADTMQALEEMGWRVNPMPLIWSKSDNRGALPDPKRGPRQTYETAFLCSRGDRFIVSAKANVIHCPTTKSIHMSEKSFEMLSHFFQMFVDKTTVMLDPTAGSGMAVRAAEAAGARFVCGLEKDRTFWERACQGYADWRKEKSA